jgi:hypothetical protein
MLSSAVRRRTGPVFSTMTSVIAPCLSALLLPPLLLLLLASSAYEQVRVVCALSGGHSCAQPTRRCRQSGRNVASLWAPRVQPLAGGVGSPLL